MIGGQRQGPVSETALVHAFRTGALPVTALVWRVGWTAWTPAQAASDLLAKLLPPLPPQATDAAESASGAEAAAERRAAAAPPPPTGAADVPPAPASRPLARVEDIDVRRLFVPYAFLISLKVFVHNLLRFLVVTLICFLPLVLYWTDFIYTLEPAALRARYRSIEAFSAAYHRLLIITAAAGLLLSALASGAVAQGTVECLRQGRTTVGTCFEAAFTHAGRLFAVAVLSLVYWIGGAAIALPVGVLAGLALGPRYHELIGAVLGLLVLVVLLCYLWVAIPAAVVEKRRAVAAFKRSGELTRGHRIGVFAIVLVLWLTASVVQALIEHLFGPGGQRTPADIKAYFAVTLSFGIAWACFIAVLAAVSHLLLRQEKSEGGGSRSRLNR
jgi:hypothetical protein